MKKKITKRMGLLIGIALILFLGINYILQMFAAQRDMVRSSNAMFRQIQNVIRENEKELETVTEEINRICLLRARAAAYMLMRDKRKIGDTSELQKIVNFLEIDELHIFDKEGNLYAGSVPEYIGLSVNSGEQIGYFAQMLTDTSMELCQDIQPNTAEAKMMQYAAVWMEDSSAFVQVGLEPERVLQQKNKNEISYIFSLFVDDDGSVLVAVDPKTNTVVGTTDSSLYERGTYELGLDIGKMKHWGQGFFGKIDGVRVYCVFQETCITVHYRYQSKIADHYGRQSRRSGRCEQYRRIYGTEYAYQRYGGEHIGDHRQAVQSTGGHKTAHRYL